MCVYVCEPVPCTLTSNQRHFLEISFHFVSFGLPTIQFICCLCAMPFKIHSQRGRQEGESEGETEKERQKEGESERAILLSGWLKP